MEACLVIKLWHWPGNEMPPLNPLKGSRLLNLCSFWNSLTSYRFRVWWENTIFQRVIIRAMKDNDRREPSRQQR